MDGLNRHSSLSCCNERLFPTLYNGTEVPKLIDNVVKSGGKGVLNGNGFYQYTPEEARLWQKMIQEFGYNISQQAHNYPRNVIKKKLEQQENDESNADIVPL
jgi:3-hydroxybutyryl-CoA dehydrogenase